MEPKYETAFSTLDLPIDGATWDEVRDSYRRKVQRLHPDRALEGDNAEENNDAFIAVTNAYKLLNGYKRRNGSLPSAIDTSASDNQPIPEKKPKADKKQRASAPEYTQAPPVDLWSKPNKKKKKVSSVTLVIASCLFILLSAFVLLSYSVWESTQVAPVTPFSAEGQQALIDELRGQK